MELSFIRLVWLQVANLPLETRHADGKKRKSRVIASFFDHF